MTAENFYRAELIDRVDFSEDLAMFRFRPDGEFSFRPGQYATLALDDGGKLVQRPYSVASAPHEPFLEFFIEMVPGGALTPRLWGLKRGDAVLVRKRIVGAFTLDVTRGRENHLMVATVTGVAPFVSILRAHAHGLRHGAAAALRFALVHGGSRSWELGLYLGELSEMATGGWLTYVPTVSRPREDTVWRGETGRVEDVLRKHTDSLGFDPCGTVAYLAGHPQMILNVRGILARARFDEEQIREEKFFAT